jgi:hypothetical protein
MSKAFPNVPIQSTAGAIPLKNEKGNDISLCINAYTHSAELGKEHKNLPDNGI